MQVDLVGGYYDAGDGVKFSFPMAFATTMLAWSVVEFGQELDMAGELRNARATIRWATDYLLKTTTTKPNTIYAQVNYILICMHLCVLHGHCCITHKIFYRLQKLHVQIL